MITGLMGAPSSKKVENDATLLAVSPACEI